MRDDGGVVCGVGVWWLRLGWAFSGFLLVFTRIKFFSQIRVRARWNANARRRYSYKRGCAKARRSRSPNARAPRRPPGFERPCRSGQDAGRTNAIMLFDGHRDMLHDIERNELYADAISKAVSSLPADASAVDIGTGSSLLACLAAQAGIASVTAFEVNPALARLARRVVADNGLDDQVSIVQRHSTTTRDDASSLDEKALLMTHELLDTGLHSEGLLGAIRHAWRELLHPQKAISVPCRVDCLVQPVSCEFLRDAAGLRNDGVFGGCIPPSVLACCGAAGYLELRAQALLQAHQHAAVGKRLASCSSAAAASTEASTCCIPLAQPLVAFSLDLTRAPPEGAQYPPAQPLTALWSSLSAPTTVEADALLTWWECTLHPETPLLSTSPHDPPSHPHAEREHWANALFLLPRQGIRHTIAIDAPSVTVRAGYDDSEMWFALSGGHGDAAAATREKSEKEGPEPPPPPPPLARVVCSCGMHTLWGADRLLELNRLLDPLTAAASAETFVKAGSRRLGGSASLRFRCLDLSDGPTWCILLARAGGECVCVETSSAMRALSAQFVAAAGLSSRISLVLSQPAVAKSSSSSSSSGSESASGDEGLGEDATCSFLPDALPDTLRGSAPFELLVVEPSFGRLRRMWAGEHLAECISRWQWAQERGLVSATTKMLPSRAMLCVSVVECPELWRRHQRVGNVCGVDVKRFNALSPPRRGEARSLALWQFAHSSLSDAGCCTQISLPAESRLISGACTLRCVKPGTCHAIVAWIDFGYGEGCSVRTGGASSGAAIRFEPTPWAQAVVFVEEPAVVGADVEVTVEVTMDLRRGGALRAVMG